MCTPQGPGSCLEEEEEDEEEVGSLRAPVCVWSGMCVIRHVCGLAYVWSGICVVRHMCGPACVCVCVCVCV